MPITYDRSIIHIDRELARLAKKVQDEAPAYRWMTRAKIDKRLDDRLRLMRTRVS